MICVFSPRSSRRLEYLLHHLIEVMWGESLLFLTDEEAFAAQAAEGKINYSDHPLPASFFIPAHPLLFEKVIHNQHVQLIQGEDFPYCFPLPLPEADMDWDVFAACFYWISRYEEYLPYRPDAHGRFSPEESLAGKNACLHLALVDRWAEHLQRLLQRKFPGLRFASRKARFTPTYDIDSAFAYLHKGFAIALGSSLKALLQGNWQDVRKRMEVYAGKTKDPYDTFDWLKQLHASSKLNPLFFILFSGRSRYDKGLDPKQPAFRELLRELAAEAGVGIHASYVSSERGSGQLQSEIDALSEAIGRPVCANRSHYLRMRLPETYRNLISCGIQDDYSMGFVTAAGFRAGTCTPFRFFDLERNESTSLLIHPLLFMENAFYGKQDADEAQLFSETIRPLLDECIRYKGEIITLFHNQSFGELPGHRLPAKGLLQHSIRYIQQALWQSNG